MRVAIYIILLLASITQLIGQEAVISEYYNDSDFKNEWTEILITKDNTSLTGYELRDNTEKYNDGNSWQKGVKFNSNNLWKNLRIGTVIVINHRGTSAIDIDPRDGYIEVDAENNLYFDRPSWNGIASLSLQQFGDVVQLLNASGTNVHALAHVKYSSQGDFYKIVGRKIAYVGDCSLGYSISIGNASKLDDYNLNLDNLSGYDTGKSITLHSPGGTKGKANKNPKGSPINYRFWQLLREPVFNTASLKATRQDSTIKLKWNKVNLLSGSNDYGGYIILKTTDLGSFCKPIDGKIYYVGQKICVTSEVLAFIQGSDITEFIDENPICGATTQYSVFAYNFYDGKSTSWNIEDGRGIAYSDVINESNTESITLDNPIDVKIDSRLGTKFCSIDTTTLFTDLPNDKKNEYSYAWYFKRELDGSETILIDFKEPGISDSVTIYRPGYYRLEIKGDNGCITESNTVYIEILEQPESYIANESGNIITKDTVVYYCDNIDYKLRADTKPKDPKELIYLYKDGIKVSNFNVLFDVKSEGEYYYIFLNGDCKDTSYSVTFEKSISEVESNLNKLDYKLPLAKNSKIDSIIITNKSDKDIIYQKSDFKIKSPFTILNSFPITLKGNTTEKLFIEFKPLTNGKYYDTLNISTACNDLKIALNGEKVKSNVLVTADKDTIDFGVLISCTFIVDTTLTIRNEGDEWVILEGVNNFGSFAIYPFIPNDTLFPNESRIYHITTTDLNTGQRYNASYIKWISESGVEGRVNLILKAFVTVPSSGIVEDTLDFGILSGCDEFIIDSVHAFNDGKVEVELRKDDITAGIEIVNAPVIIPPGDTVVVILKYSKTSPKIINKRNQFKLIPGCAGAVPSFHVIAERQEGGYNLDIKDTIDFGKFYTCDEINKTIEVDINILEKEITEAINLINIEEQDGNFNISILPQEIDENTKIPISFNKINPGKYNSTVSLTFEPCGIQREITLIAEVLEQKLDYTKTIQFASFNQGNSTTDILSITNINEDELIIESINLPQYVTFKNVVNFPIKLAKDSVLILDIEFKTLRVGEFKDSLRIVTSMPCDNNYIVFLEGTVLDTTIPPGNFIANFGLGNYNTPPKMVINIPINIYEDIYKFDSVDVESITLDLMYPFNALVLGSVKSLQNELQVSKTDDRGNLSLNLSKSDNSLFNLNSNRLLELEFYVLDVVPNDYQIEMVNGNVKSFPTMTITTEDSVLVKITENCVNNTDFTFVNRLNLLFKVENNSLNISFEQPTDDTYTMELIDNTGQTIVTILDGNQSRGVQHKNVNISSLSSGIYYLTLRYMDRILVEKVRIIK
ncbi:MAG: hypothetical protein CVV25_00185 [Ignavibacteriae bacterium HGW-Ignavibacteriae-4]|nr:MAG: hypothetical protein CVV25_00185 [Ignavibacteriae bacterium HGW-Ignavibacteriae-4]